MSRLIKDDDAVERISNAIWHLPNDMYPRFNNFDTIHAVVKDAVKGVPSIEPRAKGHWIEIALSNHTYKCSVCGRLLVNIADGKNNVAKNYPYCHCGAEMRGEEE